MQIKANDLWVNVSMGDQEPSEYLIRVKEDYFKAGDEFFENIECDRLVGEMDAAGIEKVVLTINIAETPERIFDFARRHPGRFYYSAYCQPTGRMEEVWQLEKLVREHPVVMARVVPFAIDKPPTDPIYYPLYVKCIELDLPISINTGLPGPPMPGDCQNPMHLDRICYQFPELKVCMAHGADPWWDVATRLMIKYANLRLMTSAYAPKYFPEELLHFMNTRGQNRIMFASDHPVLSFQRCLEEAQGLDLRDGVLEKYLYQNSEDFFFTERKPR